MEWNVKNAVSRDVERQHLNKILAEIRKAVTANATSTSNNAQQGGGYVGGGGGSSSSQRSRTTVILEGDITGTGEGIGTITVPTTLAADVVREAPLTSLPYWRINGDWQVVPDQVRWFDSLNESGIVVFDYDNEIYVAREITGDEEWITVEDGNGVDGNPKVTVTDAAKAGYTRIIGTAVEDIHGLRAVVIEDGEVRHPTLADVSDAVKIAGIAVNAATIGSEVTVQTGGTITEGSWTWSGGNVFVEEEGVLTQVAPTTGYVVSIGRATDSTTIDIDVAIPLIRS